MTQAERVYSTPPTSSSAIDHEQPTDTSRRRFLSQATAVAAGGAALAQASAATAPIAALASSDVDPIFALIARHRAEEQAYTDALVARDELDVPKEVLRLPRIQLGMKANEPHYLHSHQEIDDWLEWMPDFARTPKIRARLHAELDRDITEIWAKREDLGMIDADVRVEELCDSCHELEWDLANTMPTSIAGVAAVLRYANECEDKGEEWPGTDTIGSDGWHYQLRQTAARALEALQGVV
jgi:hypothetical protein